MLACAKYELSSSEIHDTVYLNRTQNKKKISTSYCFYILA